MDCKKLIKNIEYCENRQGWIEIRPFFLQYKFVFIKGITYNIKDFHEGKEGDGMISRAARIKMSFYILMVFVFSIFLQLFPIQSTYAASLHERYQSQGNKIVFDSKGQVLSLFPKPERKPQALVSAPSAGRFVLNLKTVRKKFYTRIRNDNVREQEVHTDGFTYTEFVFPIAKSTDQQFKPSIVEALVRILATSMTPNILSKTGFWRRY